jgi:hypothetical protein
MLIDQIEGAAAPSNQLVPGRLLVRPSTIGGNGG